MKYKVSLNDSMELIVVADSEFDAVRQAKAVKDAIKVGCSTGVKDESMEEKVRKAQEWVDYDIKTYGKVSEETKKTIEGEGLKFDEWNNQVHDSVFENDGFRPGEVVLYGGGRYTIVKKLSEEEKRKFSYAINPYAGDYYEVKATIGGATEEHVWEGRLKRP